MIPYEATCTDACNWPCTTKSWKVFHNNLPADNSDPWKHEALWRGMIERGSPSLLVKQRTPAALPWWSLSLSSRVRKCIRTQLFIMISSLVWSIRQLHCCACSLPCMYGSLAQGRCSVQWAAFVAPAPQGIEPGITAGWGACIWKGAAPT